MRPWPFCQRCGQGSFASVQHVHGQPLHTTACDQKKGVTCKAGLAGDPFKAKVKNLNDTGVRANSDNLVLVPNTSVQVL